MKQIRTWKGKAITDLSKEELYEVIDYLAKKYDEYTDPETIKKIALGSVEMIKRKY